VSVSRVYDPERIVTVLARHAVKFVLIGATAARLYGFPRLTADADITPARDVRNVRRLAAALRELEAKVYTESIPEGLAFDCTAETIGRSDMWNLITIAGRVDVAFIPSGTDGYRDLVRNAVRFEAFGTELVVASLEDIIRSKVAADRPKDRQDVIALHALLKRRGA
jgi:hypothetical protein